MANHTRFGPAGVPERFKKLIDKISDVPNLLHAEGLDAFEYPAVRWGQKPQIRKESAELLGIRAQENDVILSVHGSYYLNLCGKKEIVEASKRRIIACVQAAQWMNAYVMVFHPGFYGKLEKGTALKKCIKELEDVVDSIETLGIKDVFLGPETMGKQSQVGSLEEIITICEEPKKRYQELLDCIKEGRFYELTERKKELKVLLGDCKDVNVAKFESKYYGKSKKELQGSLNLLIKQLERIDQNIEELEKNDEQEEIELQIERDFLEKRKIELDEEIEFLDEKIKKRYSSREMAQRFK